MRVLITVPSLAKEFGGPVTKAFHLAEALRTRGHAVRVVGVGQARGRGTIPLAKLGGFHGTPLPRSLAPLRSAIRGADVVHVLGFRDPVGTFASLDALRHGIPYVLEPVGMLQPRIRSLTLKRGFDSSIGSRVLGGAAAVVATSSVERDDLERLGVDTDKVRVRANGVSFEGLWPLPERGPLRDRLGIPREAPLALTLTRLAVIKDLPRLVEAAAILPRFHLLIAGPDERDGTLPSIFEVAASQGASERIHVEPGGLWGADKASALAEADIFCLVSTYESFGTAAAESAGVGVPTVLTEGCGVKDVLPGAWVVPSKDSSALAIAMEHAIEQKQTAATEAVNVRRRLSWATVAECQEAIYEAVT
jgi:glycosyltransferase involved in cell wall biosynthesis